MKADNSLMFCHDCRQVYWCFDGFCYCKKPAIKLQRLQMSTGPYPALEEATTSPALPERDPEASLE